MNRIDVVVRNVFVYCFQYFQVIIPKYKFRAKLYFFDIYK